MIKLLMKTVAVIVFGVMIVSTAYGQGQDSTPAERDIMIMGEILPGLYNNANQSYFDVRLKRPERQRHKQVYRQISRVQATGFGSYVFSMESGTRLSEEPTQHHLYVLEADNSAQAVRMKTYQLNKAPGRKISPKSAVYLEGCDVLWVQEAGQFRGRLERESCVDKQAAQDLMLSQNEFWFKLVKDTDTRSQLNHYSLDRARKFDCYADMPGVGGGRDIPFQRHQLNEVHDLGGEQWFTDQDGNEIGVSLFRVMWSFNNYDGVFSRPSLVVYVKTKDDDGEVKEIGYSWTEPSAQRIGINLKWILINCYMLSNEDIAPFYKNNEPKLK